MVSFSGITVTLPFTSLFSKKKAINIAIEKPLFVLTDSLLEVNPGSSDFAQGFIIKHIDLRHGEIKFKGQDISMQLLDFNLQSGPISEGLAFKLASPHLKIIFSLNGKPVTLEGNLDAEIRQQGTFWKINQLLWQTKDITFNLNGRFLKDGSFYLNASAHGNPENILRPLLDELAVKGLTYAKAKIVKTVKNRIQIKADFTSPYCSIMENVCSNLAGNMSWNDQSRNLDLEAAFDTPLTRGWVQVTSKEGETDITIHDIPAAYMANILSISADAPLAGIISSGEIKINADFINGQANLDASPSRPLTLPFVARGNIEFQRDQKKKQATFSGRELQFNGGQVSISGQTDAHKKTVDIKISAALKNIENIAAYSAFYLDIDLLPWKLSQGNGIFSLELNIKRGGGQGKSQFAIQRFLANGQAIESLQGDIKINPLHTQGDFNISAPDLRSLAKMDIVDRITTVRFLDVHGESGKILKILNNNIALSGKIAGAFTYQRSHTLKRPLLQGAFQAPQMRFMGYPLDQVSGDLRSDLSNIELSDLQFGYKGGKASGTVAIDYQQKKFAINGCIKHIDIRRLNDKFSGQADIEVDGRGEFLKDPLEISYHLANIHFYHDREFSVRGKASILTDFSDFSASSNGELLNPAGISPLTLEISRKNSRINGQFNMNLMDLNLLVPWKNNTGTMRLLGQIYSSEQGTMRSRGVAVFSGQTLSLPNFSHSLDNFQATLTFDNMKFNLQSLSGEMGGGKVEGNGRLVFDQKKLQSLILNLQGKNMLLYPMDRVSCHMNVDLTLKYLSKKLLLSGTLDFLSANWQREIDEPIVFNTHANLSTAESKISEMLQLDINMNGENTLINNSLGRINGKFKLKLSGTAGFPVLIGTYDGNQGEIHFSDRSFNLLKAKLVFNNNLYIDPLITIESETFIQNYRIRFDIKGPASHAKPELVSSPPLPPQDILALVSLGEAFKRSGSQEISSQLGSTALITTELAKEIKNRANRLLGINLLRIDPMLKSQSAYDTSRLTIGTSITKNLIVVYSTNLSTTRQEIYYLQYQLSPAVSLIYMKNEEGRYSIDLRLRKRR
ncbi:MAG: translocation/assembly module TamB domain-containing protein [Chrysiogenales bacterium]